MSMDLQAILDEESTTSDDEEYLRRYASSCGGGRAGVGLDISLSTTVSNLSNVSSVKDQPDRPGGRGMRIQEPIMEDYRQPSPNPLQKVMGRDQVLKDLNVEEEEDIVGQILRSYHGSIGGAHRTAANLELERILRDDEGELDQDGFCGDQKHFSSNGRPTAGSQASSNGKRMDLLLQSILDEDDEDEVEVSGAGESDGEVVSPNSGSYFNNSTISSATTLQNRQQQFNYVESLSALSLSGRSGVGVGDNNSAGMRRISSSSQPAARMASDVPLSHSLEVDAILNSVQDDDSEDLDLDIRNYSKQQSSLGGYQYNQEISGNTSIDSDDDTDENDGDVGLNFNFSVPLNGKHGPLRDVKYDENISMQYPLTRKEDCKKKNHHEQNKISYDNGKQDLAPLDHQPSLKECNDEFLHGIRKRDAREVIGQSESIARESHSTSVMDAMDDEQQIDRISVLSLQYAEACERRLLKPNTRNIVSPLTVKRRMKPKVELMTKARMNGQPSTTTHRQKHQPLQIQSHQQGPRFGFSGGIIQSKSMAMLGSQLLKSSSDSTSSNQSPGLPTALAVNSKFIAVGNQKGQVWVFDLFEQLKIILSDREGAGNAVGVGSADMNGMATTGSVTSIDLSLHGDFLLAGYGSGLVILWDTIKGSILKKVADLHSSSISSARVTSVPMAGIPGVINIGGDNNTVGAVSVDAGGLVNKLTFSKGMLWSTYSVETECLLDGTAGQILAMDTLPPLDPTSQTLEQMHSRDKTVDGMDYHPSVYKIVLIALSSARSSFAVSVEPKVSVLHRWARPSTERIDPTIAEEDRLTTTSSAHASTYVSGYADSCASSYVSTSTYQSKSTAAEPPRKPSDSTVAVPYLPCLSWGWALISGGGHSVTPILARAWGCCLQFLRASFPPRDELGVEIEDPNSVQWPAFGTHDEFDASAPVVALNWLGKRSLVYLTLLNEFTIIDTVIMTMQERLDFSGMRLVYAEFALSRGTKPRPDSNGCTTFMNSIRSNDNRLLVLCQAEVKEITILGMRRQIMSLEDGGQWLEALALALDHYESAIRSQEDGQRDASAASSALTRLDAMTSSDPSLLTEDEIWMAELLMRYLILAIDNAPESSAMEFSFSNNKLPGRLNLAESHFEMLSGVCIEFCIVTRRLDLLFGPIFRCFYEARYINVFLDVMETYVLNDKLKYIAPEAMVLFVAHCKDMKDLSMVERCLLHMDCSLMDFDSILSLLKRNALYTGLFHVYIWLDDYVSPLEILFEALFNLSDSPEDVCASRRKDGIPNNKFEQYGYKAILYLQYCFEGKAFPKGNAILPEERLQSVRSALFHLLFQEVVKSPPQRTPNTQSQNRQSSSRGIRALPYPYLRALILVDTKSFLDCLTLVLDDSGARFASHLPALSTWEVEFGTDDMVEELRLPDDDENDPHLLPNRQHLVDILSSIIMSDSLVESSYHFGSRKQITLLSIRAKHSFLDFIAKYLKLRTISAPKHLTGEVFIRLCNRRGASEDDILSLLNALPRSSYELDEILYTVERVGMTRGALFLHKAGVTMSIDREGMSDKCQIHFNCSIDCYLRDKEQDFKKGVFDYARKECSGGNISMLRNVLLQRLPELVELDAVHTAYLVGEIFVEEMDTILLSLRSVDSGRVEFSFLHAIIAGDLDKVDPVAAQELAANLTANHHHSYLLLMTKLHPDLVYRYLSTNRNYCLNDALKLCQEQRIQDASAYLLERMGDVSGALKLMLENLDTRMTTLKKVLQQSSSIHHSSRKGSQSIDQTSSIIQNELVEKEVGQIKQTLSAVLDLCERNKNDHLTLGNERGPLLWFHVLDKLVNAKSLLRISKNTTDHTSVVLSTTLSELLLMSMQRMISNISLYELMLKITRDHAGSDLGEFREMLVSMLKTYSSELDVCTSAVDVMYYDIRRMSYEKKRLKVRGSFVRDCLQQANKNSILYVGPSGDCEITSPSNIDGNNRFTSNCAEAPTFSAVSSLRQRRKMKWHQAQRAGPLSERQGKSINLMTTSEQSFSPRGGGSRHGTFRSRQVGGLSEAQHIGGLF